MAYIEVEGLSKSHGNKRILDSVALKVKEHDVLAILGSSGAGKTTILRVLAGFERPDAGTVTLAGETVNSGKKYVEPEKRNVATVFQDLALWPHLTAKKHLAFILDAVKYPGSEREKE
ncbi:MAG: ATP-binding cassette domain-containing protein, partial [Candidatus Altiarchaeota archaeon]|nr:ATP-binding cassette domain-containing protein [Candidatus Altiarchaeota archaeon]